MLILGTNPCPVPREEKGVDGQLMFQSILWRRRVGSGSCACGTMTGRGIEDSLASKLSICLAVYTRSGQ